VICDQGQIAVVPFPFTDLPAAKRRPALVISKREFNQANSHTALAMITTAKSHLWTSDHVLIKPKEAGLVRASYVRWKIFTLPNLMIERIIGALHREDQTAIKTKVQAIFAWT
jgi:mRNA interferase MazF